ncbi:calcyclin-binding protein [Trichonephila clavata]|uniref:Calcyclin-binding protein n=1 Tax=Trichonephila clavata TaxID=2740835 RepID=A0A8X6HMY2_TRICU|nr:calcyclin-binding protein [Trichonephila clavata]
MSASSLRKDADELIRLAMLTEIENKKVIRPAYTTTKLYNYGWDQSDKFLKIYLTMNGIQNFPADSVNANFAAKSVEIHILDEGKKINSVLAVNNLLHPIIPGESYFKVKTDMVVVFLKKSSSVDWQCVTEVEKKSKEAKTPKFDKEEDAGASLMSLMKQMYEDGDDDMKRTIAKAWTEARDKKSPDELM